MSRSSWKGPFVNCQLNNLCQNSELHLKTKSRNSSIVPEFVGKTFQVHNGKKFVKIFVNEDMIGHKLGEFSLTRKAFLFKKVKK